MIKAIAGSYPLWFLLLLTAGKMLATSLTLGIGGSGGVFAPSPFLGVTSGMVFAVVADHVFGAGAGQPALCAVVAMGAVFTAAARAPHVPGQRAGNDRGLQSYPASGPGAPLSPPVP